MKWRVTGLVLAFFLLFINTIAYADVKKDETVYVNLNYDGSIKETIVVNHLYGWADSEYHADFGAYTRIKNMTDATVPQIMNGNEIRWPMELLKKRDIYYEGKINKELPVQISIRYFLDGRGVNPATLGGTSGHFKIEIGVEYNKNLDWGSTNLLTQVQLTLDNDVFTNIETDGSRVVIGKQANIAFVSLPPEDCTFRFEADGKNIRLDPINITLVPSNFDIPGEISEQMGELTEGLDQMTNAADELAKGADELHSGTQALKNGMVELHSGITGLYTGTGKLAKSSGEIRTGMEQFHSGLNEMSRQGEQLSEGLGQITAGVESLAEESSTIYEGIGELYGGLKKANTGTGEISDGLNQLNEGHEKLMLLAALYANSSDPLLRQLAQGIIQEGESLALLNAGLKDTSQGLDRLAEETGKLYGGFGEYKDGAAQIAKAMKEMEGQVSALPGAVRQMNTEFGKLKDGANQYFAGVSEIHKNLGLIKDNTGALPQSVQKIADGQEKLEEGILGLGDGLETMNKGISEKIGSFEQGEKENAYRSFADNERNRNSTVQFLMRTPSIDIPDKESKDTAKAAEKKSFFQRLLDLFR